MKQDIEIKRESEWCFILSGNTRQYRNELINMGGRWQSRDLEWIFDNDKYDLVSNWLGKDKIKHTEVKQENKSNEKDVDILFESFLEWFRKKTLKKDLNKIFDSFKCYNEGKEVDETDIYFCFDKLFLDNIYYEFISQNKNIKHSEFLKLDKNKMIEHALLILK